MRDTLAGTLRTVLSSRSPAVAVDGGDTTVTYDGLLAAAARIETLIVGAGAPPGSVVAIIGRRGFDLYADLLATILSGRIPAVIDAALPPDRIRQQVHLVAPAMIITADAVIDLDASVATLVTGDGSGSPVLTDGEDRSRADDVYADDVGYIAFTSGSRGAPKAIAGSATGLLHFLSWQRGHFRIGPGHRFAQMTSPSFDVFYRDVLTPLTAGATLCVPGADQARGSGILNWLAAAEVTHLHAVPSLAAYWLRDRRHGAAPSLSGTFFAGEPLPGRLVTLWRAATGVRQRVVNFYGTAEATLAQVFHDVPAAVGEPPLPVGRPIPGITVHVIDPAGTPCAPGVTGEVVVESPYLSHGFVERDTKGQRWLRALPAAAGMPGTFRTGDRGHRSEDGLLHLAGRLDREIKVRGVRVHLDEVATVLAGHPLVRQAVVVSGPDPVGGLQVEATVAIGDGPAPAVAELKAYLARSLPEQMIPARIRIRPELPLGATGKTLLRAEDGEG